MNAERPSKPMAEWTIDEMREAVLSGAVVWGRNADDVPLTEAQKAEAREFAEWATAHSWEVFYPCPTCRANAQELHRLGEAVTTERPELDSAQRAAEIYKRGGRGAAPKHDGCIPSRGAV
jgi:hypothetical protein